MIKHILNIRFLVSLLITVQSTYLFAVSDEVQMALDLMQAEQAKEAGLSELKAEAGTFEAIRLGLALSLARCDGDESCVPSINEDEMDYLLEALETRIDGVAGRTDDSEDPKEGEQLLAVFENELDSYFYYYDSIRALSGEDLDTTVNFAEDNFGLKNDELDEEDFYDEGPSIEELILTELEFYKDDPIKNDDDLGIYESDYSNP